MSWFRRSKDTEVETSRDTPWAEIVGWGTFGYRVTIHDPSHSMSRNVGYYRPVYTSVPYNKVFWFGKKRAEDYAKRKLSLLQRRINHAKYRKSIL